MALLWFDLMRDSDSCYSNVSYLWEGIRLGKELLEPGRGSRFRSMVDAKRADELANQASFSLRFQK